jgi:hypothetical protein
LYACSTKNCVVSAHSLTRDSLQTANRWKRLEGCRPMATIFRRVRVADYARFREVYDAGTPAREAGGMPDEQMFRNPK